jgi:predicted ATPase
LTGSGGVGKTRLALAAAGEAAESGSYPDGVYVVDLTPVRDSAFVLPVVGRALGIREGVERPLLEMLTGFLHPLRLLLVLDNCEHVLAAAPQVGDLLAACPGLQVLAASRAPLRLQGEHLLSVPPLALPPAGSSAPADLAKAAAVTLFVSRARAARADFTLTAENGLAISEICRRLDGLPLAIELAAARIAVLPPPALLVRMERCLPLLTGGPQDAPARQQTMRDTIAWSYDLLSAQEQRLFQRLAIFVGGCTIEAADAVTNARGNRGIEILDGISSLVDKSLLRPAPNFDGEVRFTMLETVREFGLEQLLAADELDEAGRLHAGYFLTAAEQRESTSFHHIPTIQLDRFAADHDNLGAALDRLCDGSAIDDCLRLAAACTPYWFTRGHVREGSARLNRALATAGSTPSVDKGHALNAAANLAIVMGNFQAAAAFSQGSLAIWDTFGDPRGRAASLFDLARVAEVEQRWDEAADLFDQAAAIYRDRGRRMNSVALWRCAEEFPTPRVTSNGLFSLRMKQPRSFSILVSSAGSGLPSGI